VGVNVGYGRCSTTSQDLTTQREQLTALGVAADRVYLDEGLTGTSRARPGPAWTRPWPPSATATPLPSPGSAASPVPPPTPWPSSPSSPDVA